MDRAFKRKVNTFNEEVFEHIGRQIATKDMIYEHLANFYPRADISIENVDNNIDIVYFEFLDSNLIKLKFNWEPRVWDKEKECFIYGYNDKGLTFIVTKIEVIK